MKTTLIVILLLTACGREAPRETPPPTSSSAPQITGNVQTGKELIEKYACLACHRIPGFAEPQGSMGPSLEGIASRPAIAGRVPNDPATMVAYLQNPPAVDPATRMPPLGISEEEARHMTAYLFTLQ